jgi:hypothetical protein
MPVYKFPQMDKQKTTRIRAFQKDCFISHEYMEVAP